MNILNNIIRVGIVDQLNPQTCSAVVRFEDQEEVISSELPILVRGSAVNKDYWMPSINDAVVCLFIPVGLADGFVVGTFYNSDDLPPVADASIEMKQFGDGTKLFYDVGQHILNAAIAGSLNISAKNMKLQSDSVSIESKDINLGTGGDGVLTESTIAKFDGTIGGQPATGTITGFTGSKSVKASA